MTGKTAVAAEVEPDQGVSPAAKRASRAVRLTESAITKAANEVADTGVRRDLADKGCAGLRLRLTPAGAKTWVLACRDREGRMRRFVLGVYGDKEGQMGVAAARDAARALHVDVKQKSADPIAEKRRQLAVGRDAKAGIGTLAALLILYGDNQGGAKKSWPEARRRIESVFAAHLKRPLDGMRVADLQMTADKWAAKQSAAAAVRYIRPVLKWAAKRRYASADLATITPPAVVGRRTRTLSREELAAVLPALAESDRTYAKCLHFLLLTVARREEAAAAKWGDIDLDQATWTIPETKNGQPHVVPLSDQAVTLLRGLLPKNKKGEPVTTVPDSALVFTTATGGALMNWDRETKLIHKASKTEDWTRHDLRRTGATLMGEMGELPDIIEAALNHVSIRSQLAATYNRSRYRPQVAAALQRLADALDGIAAGGAEVVQLHRAKAI